MDCTYSCDFEKQKMKKAATARSCTVGIFILVSSVVSSFFTQLYYNLLYGNESEVVRNVGNFVSSVFGISRVEGSVVVRNVLFSGVTDELFSMISMLVCLFLPAYLAGKIWGKSVSDCFEINGKFVKGVAFIYAFTQIVMYSMTSISDGIWKFLFPGGTAFDSAGASDVIPVTNNAFAVIISFLCTCVLVPVIEEYVFRGVVYRIFEDVGVGFAVVASALCFGLMHASASQCMYAFAFGLFSALFVAVTGNIKTSVLFHMLNNTVSSMTVLLPEFLGESIATAIDVIYILYVFSFAFYGMYLFFSKKGLLYKFREVCNVNDTKKKEQAKLSYFFTVPVVIFVVLFAARMAFGAV